MIAPGLLGTKIMDMSQPATLSSSGRPSAAMLSIGLGLFGWVVYGVAIFTHQLVPHIGRSLLASGGERAQMLYGPLYSLPSLMAAIGILANAVGLGFSIASFWKPGSLRRHSYAGLAVNGVPCCLATLGGIGVVLLIAAYSRG